MLEARTRRFVLAILLLIAAAIFLTRRRPSRLIPLRAAHENEKEPSIVVDVSETQPWLLPGGMSGNTKTPTLASEHGKKQKQQKQKQQIPVQKQQQPLSRPRWESSKDVADRMVNDFLEKLAAENSMGPIIVGGLGDSGTRGIVIALKRFGTEMLGEEYLQTITDKDSALFSNSYPTTTSTGERRMRSAHTIYPRPLMEQRRLNYSETGLSYDFWHTARQYMAQMLNASMEASLVGREGQKPLDPWGFKHPRTSFLLPFWLNVLKERFVFVHVIRDVKDMVKGNNQIMIRYVCQTFLYSNCTENDTMKAHAWARFNEEVFNYALNSGMRARQYYAIRIEDIVLKNEACLWRLRHYLNLNISSERMQRRFNFSLESGLGHEASYFGYRLGSTVRDEVESELTNDPAIRRASEFWGYRTDRFGLAEDCESLPWMELMRRKKGPLPGDGMIPNTNFSVAPQDVLYRPENQNSV